MSIDARNSDYQPPNSGMSLLIVGPVCHEVPTLDLEEDDDDMD